MSETTLWADVPEEQRATDSDIVSAWEGGSSHYRDIVRARLLNPPCGAAVQLRTVLGASVSGKLIPCGIRASHGERLCWRHGGRRKTKVTPRWRVREKAAWEAGYAQGLADSIAADPTEQQLIVLACRALWPEVKETP